MRLLILGNYDRTNFKTTHEHEIFGDRDLPSWLTEQQISLPCTTYQTSRLMLIGAVPETNRISAFWRIFDRAMGLFCTPERLYLSSNINFDAIGFDIYLPKRPRMRSTNISTSGNFI